MLPLLLCWVALSPIVAVLVGRATRASVKAAAPSRRPAYVDLVG